MNIQIATQGTGLRFLRGNTFRIEQTLPQRGRQMKTKRWIALCAIGLAISLPVVVIAQSTGVDSCKQAGDPGCPGSTSSYPSPSPSAGRSSSDNNSASTQQLLQGAIGILGQWAEDEDRRDEERHQEQERLRVEAEGHRLRAERLRAQALEQEMNERTRQLAASERTPDGSASDNPWGGGSAGGEKGEGDKDGDGGGGASTFTALDPDHDHSGKGCGYFTCSSVRADGGGTRTYANGAFVIYGKHAYECQANHWVKQGPASVWLPSGKKNLAENQERGCKD